MQNAVIANPRTVLPDSVHKHDPLSLSLLLYETFYKISEHTLRRLDGNTNFENNKGLEFSLGLETDNADVFLHASEPYSARRRALNSV